LLLQRFLHFPYGYHVLIYMSKHTLYPRLHNEQLIVNHPKFRLLKGATSEPNRSIGVADKPSDRGPGRKRQDMRIDRTEEKKKATGRAMSSLLRRGIIGFTIGSTSMLRIVPCRVIASRGNGGDTRWRRPRQAGSIEPPVVARGHRIHSVFVHSTCASHIIHISIHACT